MSFSEANLGDRISANFRWVEVLSSEVAARRGISNIPTDPKVFESLRRIVLDVAEPARKRLRRGIRISSGYRDPDVNRLVGGASNSDHLRGEALDLIPLGASLLRLLDALSEGPFDKLIWEFGAWIHVSYYGDFPGSRLLLRARSKNGRTYYETTTRAAIAAETE